MSDEKPVDLEELEAELRIYSAGWARDALRAIAELRAARERLAELEQSLEAEHVRTVIEKLRVAKEQLAEARRDSERLDWLDDVLVSHYTNQNWRRLGNPAGGGIRASIDAAREAGESE